MDLGIKNKIALVTGGATGIGKSIAINLAKEGSIVIITSRKKKNLIKTLKILKNYNSKSEGFVVDVTKKNSPKLLINKIIKKFRSIDIVVNNVGDTLGVLDPYCSIDKWIKIFKLILGVAIEINNSAIPYMKKNKWGRIVNITAGAVMENSGPVPYCSMKSAFNAYSS